MILPIPMMMPMGGGGLIPLIVFSTILIGLLIVVTMIFFDIHTKVYYFINDKIENWKSKRRQAKAKPLVDDILKTSRNINKDKNR